MLIFSEITEDEFFDTYKFQPNHFNPDAGWSIDDDCGCMFETYGEELEYVKSVDPRNVWTIVNGSDGGEFILSGFHVVNRVGYLVSLQPIQPGLSVQVTVFCGNSID